MPKLLQLWHFGILVLKKTEESFRIRFRMDTYQFLIAILLALYASSRKSQARSTKQQTKNSSRIRNRSQLDTAQQF
ncbi:MAG: hypothetical protein EZS28_030722 [Streblomastix strix]|uniref:Uncharacterized protein n=1 Tax=Streblomastix strix TaxID=222440 RepID=A0A5J4UUN6_9EUKA|nr:MAG: hypothetical protein EZS28_030722 [Streblomastix strix]